jgi:hypothetical protein
MIFLTIGIAVVFMDYYVNLQEKNSSIILFQLTLFIIMTGIGGFILNGTSPYFAGRRIKNEIE